MQRTPSIVTDLPASPRGQPSLGLLFTASGWRRAGRILLNLLPALALLALTGWAVLQGQAPYPSDRYWYMDQNRYIAMAQHPFAADPLVREPPFAWRLLTPLVVHIMPLPTLVAFWLLTVVCLIAAAYALAWFLEGLGLPRQAAIAGMLAFVFLAPATGFTLWDYMLNDPLSFALLAAALGCAVHRRGALLVVALLLGVVNKEVNILAAVFAVAWAWQQRDRVMLRWALGGAAACVLALVGIRLAIPTSAPYNVWQMFLDYNIHIPRSAKIARLFQATIFSWMLLLPLAALQLVHRPRIWLWPAFTLLFLGASAQFLVATDVERLVVYGFPVMIAAVAFEIEYLARRFSISRWWIWVPLLGCQLAWWLLTYAPDQSTWALPYPLVNKALKLLLPLVTVVLVGWCAGRLLLQRRRAQSEAGTP